MDGKTEEGEFSMELLVIVVISVIILTLLLAVAVSRMCCSLLTMYSEYKLFSAAVDDEAQSTKCETGSVVKSEKLALIHSSAQFERKTGLRLQDYPFGVDYTTPLPLLLSTDMVVSGTHLLRGNLPLIQNDDSDSSQELGSDSPDSNSYIGSHASSVSEDERFGSSVSPKTDDYASPVLNEYIVSSNPSSSPTSSSLPPAHSASPTRSPVESPPRTPHGATSMSPPSSQGATTAYVRGTFLPNDQADYSSHWVDDSHLSV